MSGGVIYTCVKQGHLVGGTGRYLRKSMTAWAEVGRCRAAVCLYRRFWLINSLTGAFYPTLGIPQRRFGSTAVAGGATETTSGGDAAEWRMWLGGDAAG